MAPWREPQSVMLKSRTEALRVGSSGWRAVATSLLQVAGVLLNPLVICLFSPVVGAGYWGPVMYQVLRGHAWSVPHTFLS